MSAKMRSAGALLIAILLILAVWQAAVSVFQAPPYILPSPGSVFVALWVNRASFARHTLVTLQEILIGLGCGIALGMSLAALMSLSPAIRTALLIPILATQTTPIVAIAPILIIWFGIGLLPKVIVVTLFAFFPVVVNTLAGFQAAGTQMLLLMESVAAKPWQVYLKVRLPMALPQIFAGIRLASAAAVVGAIVVEWVSSSAGLGYLLILYQSRLNVDRAFADLLLLMALGVVIFAIMALLERRFSWSKRLGVE